MGDCKNDGNNGGNFSGERDEYERYMSPKCFILLVLCMPVTFGCD